jgi:hypothetical protein
LHKWFVTITAAATINVIASLTPHRWQFIYGRVPDTGRISKTGRAKPPIPGSTGVSPVDGAKRRPHAGFDAVMMPVPRRFACPVFEMRPPLDCREVKHGQTGCPAFQFFPLSQ